MKKLHLLVLSTLFALTGCAGEAGDTLPTPTGNFSVELNPANSGLTSDDSTETKLVTLTSKENEEVTYQIEIGFPCYLKTLKENNLQEIIVKNGAYFKSVSTYRVSVVRVDIFEGKGINYNVYNNVEGSGEALERHASTATPVYPEDSGAVYDYQVDANGWSITNNSNNKPAFYSVTIFFEI